MQKGNAEIERELNFSFALQNQIKANYEVSTELEKTTIAKAVVGRVIRKHRFLGDLKHIVSARRFQYRETSLGLFRTNKFETNANPSLLHMSFVIFFVTMKTQLSLQIKKIF